MEKQVLRNFIRESVSNLGSCQINEQSAALAGVLLSTNPANAPGPCDKTFGKTGDEFLAIYVGGILAGSLTPSASAVLSAIRVVSNVLIVGRLTLKVFDIINVWSTRAPKLEKVQKTYKIAFEIFAEIALYRLVLFFSRFYGAGSIPIGGKISVPNGTGPISVALSQFSRIFSSLSDLYSRVPSWMRFVVPDFLLGTLAGLAYLNLDNFSTKFAEYVTGYKMMSFIEDFSKLERSGSISIEAMNSFRTELDEYVDSWMNSLEEGTGNVSDIKNTELSAYVSCAEIGLRDLAPSLAPEQSKTQIQTVQEYFKTLYPYLAPKITDVESAQKYMKMSKDELFRLNFSAKMGLDSKSEIRNAP